MQKTIGDPMKRLVLLAAAVLLTSCNLGGELTVETPDNVVNGTTTIDPDDPVDEEDLNNLITAKEIDVARVTIHRLNRAEYNNTVRDLLGDSTRPADDFPDDDFGYGFNNIADVLSIAPIHVEMYAFAAEALIENALAGGVVDSEFQRFQAEDVGGSVGSASGGSWNLFSNGSVETVVTFPVDGQYTFRASMRQQQAGPDPRRERAILGLFAARKTARRPN